MDDSELALYKSQLEQVSTALESDPDNDELQTLKVELENLISLTQSLVHSTAPDSSSITTRDDTGAPTQAEPRDTATPAQVEPKQANGGKKHAAEGGTFASGQEVLARYSSDGRFYPARIVAIAGDPASPLYTVVYKGYGNTEMLPSTSLKSISSHPPPPPPPASTSTPVGPPPPAEAPHPPPPKPMDEKAYKKHRNEKKILRREEKSALQVEKAASWQKFASKATKTKVLKSKSIFQTSDDPYAKVGISKQHPSQSSSRHTLG